MHKVKWVLVAFVMGGGVQVAFAQTTGVENINFPTAGIEEAQIHFREGVAAIHNFWWDEARRRFQEAQRIDPDFAMAYWGEAMAWFYPWSFGDARSDSVRSILGRLAPTPEARLEKAPTERERDYLRSLEPLIAEGTNASRRRDFAAAMRALAHRYPDDTEAQAFLALSLFGAVEQLREDPATQREAVAAADRVLARYPTHPGALHYTIHALDTPTEARQALEAAERYDSIVPAASHAIHMPSHIYVQLGRWEDVERANATAFRVSDEHTRARGQSIEARDYHALSWLPYARLQMGRYREAWETVEMMERVVEETGSRNMAWYYAQLAAQHVIETRNWREGSLPRSGFNNRTEFLGVALNGIHTGNLEIAEEVLEQARSVLRRNQERSPDAVTTIQWEITVAEIDAALKLHRGDGEDGVRILRAVIERLDHLDPPNETPSPVKPPEEMLGELLLEIGRYADAVAMFELALSRQAGRAAALLGLARAHEALEHVESAGEAYGLLLDQWQNADPGIPGLAEARYFTNR